MAVKDPRVDIYIAEAEEFARPILRRLREAVHAAAPDVEEAMKWNSPHFVFEGILCSMSAFKRHCTFGFWKERLMLQNASDEKREVIAGLSRISDVSELPDHEILVAHVQEAVALNLAGTKVPKAASRPAEEIPMPDAFRVALEQHPGARAAFERMSPSHRREYVEWIAEAKRDETRSRRIGTALQWLVEGKARNWKYMKPSP